MTRTFGEVRALAGVSLALSAGEWVALVGPSGCGKTSLLQVLGLLDRPNSGQTLVGGENGWERSASWRARARLQKIGFVFQNHNLLGHLTARENVALPAWRLGGSRRRSIAEAEALLERFAVAERAGALARTLSTGEAQRVAIARSLVNRPAVVLADEPTGSLDSASAESVLGALGEVAASGAALLVVTHDREVAGRASRVITMRDGALTVDAA